MHLKVNIQGNTNIFMKIRVQTDELSQNWKKILTFSSILNLLSRENKQTSELHRILKIVVDEEQYMCALIFEFLCI